MGRVKAFLLPIALAVASACCPMVSGELITPISVTSATAHNDFLSASHLCDDSGLSKPIGTSSTHAGQNYLNSWATIQPGDLNDTDYYDSGGDVPILTFELPNKCALECLVLWNYAGRDETAENGAKNITVAFSQNGLAGPFSDENDAVHIIADIRRISESVPVISAQCISLDGVHLANAVQLTITDNHCDGNGTGGDRVGLGEVKFLAPEPSSLLLMGIGVFALSIFLLLRFCCEKVGCHAHACRGHVENAGKPPHAHDKRGHGARSKVFPQP